MRLLIEGGGSQPRRILPTNKVNASNEVYYVRVEYQHMPEGTDTSGIRRPISLPTGYAVEGFAHAAPGVAKALVLFENPYGGVPLVSIDVPEEGIPAGLRRYDKTTATFEPSMANGDDPEQVTIHA